MAKPVVVRSYQNTNEAYANKCLLEDAGIQAYLYDEYTPSILPSPSSGTKIVVPEFQVEEALKILDQNFDEINASEIIQVDESLICPKCNSKRIFLNQSRITLGRALLFLLLGFFYREERKRYKCRDCQNTWWSF